LQQAHEDFRPKAFNYNPFRSITTDEGFAMGPSRANPLTGEIFDADIIFDASMVRYYRRESVAFGGSGAMGDISPIRAQQRGLGLSALVLARGDPGVGTRPGRAL